MVYGDSRQRYVGYILYSCSITIGAGAGHPWHNNGAGWVTQQLVSHNPDPFFLPLLRLCHNIKWIEGRSSLGYDRIISLPVSCIRLVYNPNLFKLHNGQELVHMIVMNRSITQHI